MPMSAKFINDRRDVKINNDPKTMTGVKGDLGEKRAESPGQRVITGPLTIIRAEYAKSPHVRPEKRIRCSVNRYEMLGTLKMPS